MEAPSLAFKGRNDGEMNEMIRRADQIKNSDDFEMVTEIPAFNQAATLLFPAITIPAERKTKFSCPNTHIEVLKKILPKVTKLLIIGWRGAEKHFLDMAGPIFDQTYGPLKIGIVSASRKSCSETEVAVARAITVDREWK